MNEYGLLSEIPGNGRFHSCLLTTFAFDLYFFEEQVLRTLRAKGVSNFIVLADAWILTDTLGNLSSHTRAAGKYYYLAGIDKAQGVFHPKIMLLLGEEEALLFTGSGNLTPFGHGGNQELWGAIHFDGKESPNLPLLHHAMEYLESLAGRLPGIGKTFWEAQKEESRLFGSLPAAPPAFVPLDTNTEAAFLHSGRNESIFTQLQRLVPPEKIEAIHLASPFYDVKGHFLSELRKGYPRATIRAAIQKRYGQAPLDAPAIPNLDFVDWDTVKRETEADAFRVQHSKLFHFFSEQEQYLLFGSANATIAAMGTAEKPGTNEEACLLLRSRERNFLEELGLNFNAPAVPVSYFKENRMEPFQSGMPGSRRIARLEALHAHEDEMEAFIHLEEGIQKMELRLFSKEGEVLLVEKFSSADLKKGRLLFRAQDKEAFYGQLFDEEGMPVSARQPVQHVRELYSTHPSKSNRKRHQIEEQLERGNLDPYIIIEYFNEIITGQASKEEMQRFRKNVASEEETMKAAEKHFPTLSREELQELALLNSSRREEYLNTHHSLKLWEAVYQGILAYRRRLEEEEVEAEESGKKDEGKEWETITVYTYIHSSSQLAREKNGLLNSFKNYSKLLDALLKKEEYLLSRADLTNHAIILWGALANVNRKYRRTKGEEILEEGVFLPELGDIDAYDNFSGAVLHLTGKFISVLAGAKGFARKEEGAKDKKLLRLTGHVCSLNTLALLYAMQLNPGLRNMERWVKICLFNLNQLLPIETRPDLEEEFKLYQTRQENLSKFNLESALASLKKLEEEYRSLEGEPTQLSNGIYKVRSLGFCYINDMIPCGRANPKALRLSRPGFSYDAIQGDFIQDNWFEIKSGRLLGGAQKKGISYEIKKDD